MNPVNMLELYHWRPCRLSTDFLHIFLFYW